MNRNCKIVRGPLHKLEDPLKSLGEVVLDKLREKKASEVILIDSNAAEELTYGKVLERSVKLAINLAKLGIERDDVIAVVSTNTWKYPIIMFAGLYLGVKGNFIDHESTKHELTHFFTMCQPKVLFCAKKHLRSALELKDEQVWSGLIVLMDEDTPSEGVKTFDQLLLHVSDDDIANFSCTTVDIEHQVAIILGSSGTTGLPKNANITHKNILTNLPYMSDPLYIGLNEDELTIGYLPFSHIFGAMICISSILYGSKLITMEKFIPNEFLKIIQDYKVTKLFSTPSIIQFLIKHPSVTQYDISSVRDILCSTGNLSQDLHLQAEECLNIIIRQSYGMTETGGGVTVVPPNEQVLGSVGKVVSNLQVKIRDLNTDESLGPNKIGEICMRGEGVIKSYQGNDKATKAAFDQDGFYKSGDLGYYDEQEYFYIVDRLKEIIKCKGYQVSPTELEFLLMKHPGVNEVVVVGKPDERAGELPMAFVVKQSETLTEADLVQYVADHVAPHKQLKGGVVFIEKIPRNDMGKFSRKQLKEMLKK